MGEISDVGRDKVESRRTFFRDLLDMLISPRAAAD